MVQRSVIVQLSSQRFVTREVWSKFFVGYSIFRRDMRGSLGFP